MTTNSANSKSTLGIICGLSDHSRSALQSFWIEIEIDIMTRPSIYHWFPDSAFLGTTRKFARVGWLKIESSSNSKCPQCKKKIVRNHEGAIHCNMCEEWFHTTCAQI